MTSTVYKVVVVGDAGTGKRSLIYSFASKVSSEEVYMPRSNDSRQVPLLLENRDYEFDIHCISGQEDCDRLRQYIYADASAFIVCYSVDSVESFRNARFKWVPEVKGYAGTPTPPITLVACKEDLRAIYMEGDERIVTTEEGHGVATSLGAHFTETSSHRLSGVDDCFSDTLRLILGMKIKESKYKKKKPKKKT